MACYYLASGSSNPLYLYAAEVAGSTRSAAAQVLADGLARDEKLHELGGGAVRHQWLQGL